MMSANRVMPFLFGLAMSLNFILFWAVPIMGMGGLWKSFIKQFLLPIITSLDGSPLLRNFAKEYVYTKPEHADFFLTSALIIINSAISLTTVFYWQLSTGRLPYWLIFAYYCSWVGIGGRTMGGAYALAHKEVSAISHVYLTMPLLCFMNRSAITLMLYHGFTLLCHTSTRELLYPKCYQ